ncbi:hypothetical protein PCE31106_03137 [Pandoraea cepalis]|uniref:TnsA endonuclease N-terminal domain-containing protein n=1 Tax=Pandoraea cepalis TaxID=2508294 RepID=A0A5E4W9K6_9BURK|nr:hypothetical protein [Pandoraea cepalis]VVE21111.1 hypothetical protein PCE31106_03137 [Pandoraea cepalis]
MSSTTSHPATNARPGTRMRAALADAYDKRGHRKANLCYVYSPKSDRDWALSGQLELAHFVIAESTPDIVSVNYAPVPRQVSTDTRSSVISWCAEVRRHDGMWEWRCLGEATDPAKEQARVRLARAFEAEHCRLSEHDLRVDSARIHNWLRIIHWLALYRGIPLAHESMAVGALLDAGHAISLKDVARLDQVGRGDAYIAAAFRLVQSGYLALALGNEPLSLRTELVREGVPS